MPENPYDPPKEVNEPRGWHIPIWFEVLVLAAIAGVLVAWLAATDMFPHRE